jgi:integrase
MPREWNGYVKQSPGRSTWQAKWKEWGTEVWRITRGLASKVIANDYLADKRREYRQRRRGDFDPYEAPRRLPIAQHVDAFHQHVLDGRRRRSGPRSDKNANMSKSRLTAAFAKMKVRTLADLTSDRVERFLAQLLDANRAMKTRNDYCAVLRQFTRWAVAGERLARDPLGNVRFLDATADQKRKQTLTWERVRELAAAAPQRVLQNARGRTLDRNLEVARRRALIVTTMFLTGLRNNELAHLQWDWIDQADKVVTIPHTVTKSGRTEFVPLHAGLGELLERERKRRGASSGRPVAGSDLVVGLLVNGKAQLPRWVVARLREDAKWLKLAEVDERGRVLTLYSMRSSFATQLDALGVPAGVVSQLMRHRPGDVTQEHYVQRANAMLLQAINTIPAEAAHVPGLWTAEADDAAARETGDPRKAPRRVTAGSDRLGSNDEARAQ